MHIVWKYMNICVEWVCVQTVLMVCIYIYIYDKNRWKTLLEVVRMELLYKKEYIDLRKHI